MTTEHIAVTRTPCCGRWVVDGSGCDVCPPEHVHEVTVSSDGKCVHCGLAIFLDGVRR